MKQQIKTWGTRTFSIVLVVIAAHQWGVPVYNQYFNQKKKDAYVPTTAVRRGQMTISFHEIGTLEADKSVPVNTETGGKIISLVQDGNVVKAGARIAVLDTADLEREVLSKRLAYENAVADVNRAKAELNILKESNRTEVEQSAAQLDFDKTELARSKKDLERQTRLAEDKLVPRSNVDKAEFDVRSKDLEVLKNTKALALKMKDVESKEQQKVADVRNVEFRANMAKMDLDRSQAQIKDAVVFAPTSGLVVIAKSWTPDGRRKLQEGDSVHQQQTLCSLPDLSTMQVKVNVGEADAPKIKPGLPVLIRLDAVPKRIFHGTIEEISNLATEASPWESNSTPGRKNFEVTITIKETDPKTLKPGMTADVEFICDEIKDTVYVPIEAVNERDGKTYVFIVNGKRYERTEVKTGQKNDNFIAVTSGLKKDQKITLRDPTRPIEEQEAGTATDTSSDAKKDAKAPAPIPEVQKKK